jgi:hypothetical protein
MQSNRATCHNPAHPPAIGSSYNPFNCCAIRGAATDGALEYVFEAGEQDSRNAVTKEKAAEIAAYL